MFKQSKSAQDGTIGNGYSSSYRTITGDGNFVFFSSSSTNLISNDTNNADDIFRKNMTTGEVTLISETKNHIQANATSRQPVVTGNGKYAVFVSSANNLSSQDSDNMDDIYLKNLETGDIQLVSITAGGVKSNGASHTPSISDDGRYILFLSNNSNLIGDYPYDYQDHTFMKDMKTGSLKMISVLDITQVYPVKYATISPNGKYYGFFSESDLLKDDKGPGQYVAENPLWSINSAFQKQQPLSLATEVLSSGTSLNLSPNQFGGFNQASGFIKQTESILGSRDQNMLFA